MSLSLHKAVLCTFLGVSFAAYGGNATQGASYPDGSTPPNEAVALPIPAGQIDRAVGQLDALAAKLMASSGIPGMAVAAVHGGKTVYAKGFGVRAVGSPQMVDADTVFQLASMSKPIGATVVAQQVGAARVQWHSPVQTWLPDFSLADPFVSGQLTIGDLYAHRSGLPDHAGDLLEDMGYDRAQVLERLRYLSLKSFRNTYEYTNFGLTAAGQAVAVAAGTDWATLSEQAIYRPLGMNATSSRFADFQARANRAPGHIQRHGAFVVGPARQPDAQSPAGGVSSSVSDVAKWMAFVLANGQPLVPAAALLPAVTPQIVSSPAGNSSGRAGFYGYGFNVGTSAAGRVTLGHSGAFLMGAATAFTIIPSADVAIVVLTNAWPIGVPETLVAQFSDLVQFGSIQRNWATLAASMFAPFHKPSGSLVGVARPAQPTPAAPLASYAGTYQNAYYGALDVVEKDGALELRLGPKPLVLPLSHWDGDVFTFTLDNENAVTGSISKASFSNGQVVLEYYNAEGLGTFRR